MPSSVLRHSDESLDFRVVDMYVFHLLCQSSCLYSQEKEIEHARFTAEIRAGLTTFFTMAYVISVNVSRESEGLRTMTNRRRPPSWLILVATAYAMMPMILSA